MPEPSSTHPRPTSDHGANLDPRDHLDRRRVLAALASVGAVGLVGPGSIRAALGSAGSGHAAGDLGDGSPDATVVVDTATRVGSVPPRMMGFSVERSTLCLPWLQADNVGLVTLLGRLGPGVLRIGGNSVDVVGWDPTGPGRQPGVVAPPDIDRLAAFVEAIGWTVIYGTPFLLGTEADVADEVAVVSVRLGARLEAVELANEPDLYFLEPAAAAVATWPTFHARWQAVADAVTAAAPGVAFAGPGSCLLQSIGTWTAPFVAAEHGRAPLVTQHYYRGFGLTPQDIPLLLGPDPLLQSSLTELAGIAGTHGVRYRLGETNSFANGGQPGVSNTMASALWMIQLWFAAAQAGADGLNVHNSGNGAGYPAIAQLDGQITQVRPLYHGLLLLAAAGPGDLLSVTAAGAPEGLAAYAVRDSPTYLSVVVVNPADQAVDLAIELGVPVASASVGRLSAPSLDATAHVAFRGAEAAVDGGWEPLADETLAVEGSSCRVVLGPNEAALVTLRPGPAVPVTAPSTSTSTSSETIGSSSTSSSTAASSSTSSSTSPSSTSTSVVEQPGGATSAPTFTSEPGRGSAGEPRPAPGAQPVRGRPRYSG